ncbi:hypothetical protein NDU88_002712 [Pleurodeles waltl]|uniref:Uncharacterized protein n=1 Tax=Pleurodeles waltl TaxID=8319 RepID=A0AAV7T3K1_PLEWA|nr:hypothetical protein NDU88_002712 [Pleurodeles waltl]
MKAQIQNCNEKNKFDLQKREIENNRRRSLSVISNNMREIRETLREIRASTGCSKWATSNPAVPVPESLTSDSVDNPMNGEKRKCNHPDETAVKNQSRDDGNIWSGKIAFGKECCNFISTQKNNFGESTDITSRQQSMSCAVATDCKVQNMRGNPPEFDRVVGLTDADSERDALRGGDGKGRDRRVTACSPSKSGPLSEGGNFNVTYSETEACGNNGKELLPEGTILLSIGPPKSNGESVESQKIKGSLEEVYTLQKAGSRHSKQLPTLQFARENSSDTATKKASSRSTRFFIPANPGTVADKEDSQDAGPFTCAPIPHWSEKRSQSAPVWKMRKNVRVKSAPGLFFKDDGENVKTSKSSSEAVLHVTFEGFTNSKSRVKVALSKAEKERALKQLILSSNKPVDRTMLEKAKQRLLQEKITGFIASITLLSKNDSSTL